MENTHLNYPNHCNNHKSQKPLIQIALDTLTIEQAVIAAKTVAKYVDIIEVGTILLVSCGKLAIDILRAVFPDKLIVADMKIADAGSVFGKIGFDAQADLITVIHSADINTLKGVCQLAQKYPNQPEVQIELTGDFSDQQLMAWKHAGATHVVYHRSRDAQAAGVEWSEKDLNDIKRIQNAGFKVSITGGIDINDIKFFHGLKPFCFIAGRTIRGKDAVVKAELLSNEINKYFGHNQ